MADGPHAADRDEAARAEALTEAEMKALEERYDPEVRFRPLTPPLHWLAATALFVLSCYHFYTAGFGIPQATTHRGTHLAFTLGLIFLSFVAWGQPREPRNRLLTPLGLPLVDWALAIAGVVSALYVPWIFADLAFRVGDPLPIDVVMGTILIVVLLEATRRAMGWPLPVIAILFMPTPISASRCRACCSIRARAGRNIVNHLYLTSQGIYGTALGVISTYVFHFVLFGVLATRIGLGQLFIDLASAVAGRYAGGPAKVSVLSSAMLGSISGSSIANTVTTGSLTIPAMIRIGYPRHFAAAVEAASSTGGQITPPVMGAVAFLMIEYLGVPLTTILTAALVPAFMHFFGVLVQVHLEARRHGLRGLTREELPVAWTVFKAGWLTTLPLFVLVAILLSGRTPYLAAFWGIASCLLVLVIQNLIRHDLLTAARNRCARRGTASSSAPSIRCRVTAAAALVGVIIGVVTLTGVGFKIAYMVTSVAAGWAESVVAGLAFLPFEVMRCDLAHAALHADHDGHRLRAHGLRHPHDRQLPDHDRGGRADPGAAGRAAASSRTSSSSTTACWPTSRRPWRWRPMRRPASPTPTPSRPATPRSGWAWARRWCRSSSSSRPRCCW